MQPLRIIEQASVPVRGFGKRHLDRVGFRQAIPAPRTKYAAVPRDRQIDLETSAACHLPDAGEQSLVVLIQQPPGDEVIDPLRIDPGDETGSEGELLDLGGEGNTRRRLEEIEGLDTEAIARNDQLLRRLIVDHEC